MLAVGKLRVLPIPLPLITVPEIIKLYPNEQKAIAIVHYTNNAIDSFYGEKFGMQPYSSEGISTGFGRHFRFHIPWLMWHKNPECCYGQTFYVDPAGYDLFYPNTFFSFYYINSQICFIIYFFCICLQGMNNGIVLNKYLKIYNL